MKKEPQRAVPPRRDLRADDESGHVTSANNIAHDCLKFVRKYILIADISSVQRVEPEAREGVLEEVRAYGWHQALRQPLENIVGQSKQRCIEYLRPLKPFADKAFIHHWDAWTDTASELAILVARDLWKEVEKCEQKFGIADAWGHLVLRNGHLFAFITEEWRFRDMRFDWLGRCVKDEFFAWEKSTQDIKKSVATPQKKRGPKPKFVDPDEEAILREYKCLRKKKAVVEKLKLQPKGRVSALKRVERIVGRDRQRKSRRQNKNA